MARVVTVTPPVCGYCNQQAVLVSATVVYGPTGRGNLWMCPSWPDCDAYVGVHEGIDPKPKGTIANAPLRALRVKVHHAFDPQWQRKPDGSVRLVGRNFARRQAYKRLGSLIGMSGREVHIGEFDVAQCLAALDVLRGQG